MNIYDESTSENSNDDEIETLLDKIEEDHQEFFDKEWNRFQNTPNEIIESEKTDLGLVELYNLQKKMIIGNLLI